MKKIRRPDTRDGWYEIDPASAISLLDKQHKNRPLREARAERIAGDIRAGKYGENGEPMIFCPAGRLLDGQTRARAVVISGRAITSYCVFGVSPAQFDTMDQGSTRSTQDLLATLGVIRYGVMAAAARWCIRYESTWIAHEVPIRNWAVDDWVRKNGDRLAMALHKMEAAAGGPFPKGIPVAAVLFLLFHIQDHPRADEFIHGLASGANHAPDSPLLVLRKRLQPGMSVSRFHQVAFLIKAWQAFRDGRRRMVLKWLARPGGGEPLPLIDDGMQE
jgi:hypothetical protein